MNEPIINPWLVYFVMQINNLIAALATGGVIMAILSLVYLMCTIEEYDDEKKAEKLRRARKWACVAAVPLALAFAIPSKSTLISVTVARSVTKENVSAAGGALDEARATIKSDVLEIIRAIQSAPSPRGKEE